LQKILGVAIAGACGSLMRYGISVYFQRKFDGGFPWGTLTVNLVGCFLFGLIWGLIQERLSITPEMQVTLLVGFMGAFTTFSTFAFETQHLLRDQQWGLATINILVQVLGGLACISAGFASARAI